MTPSVTQENYYTENQYLSFSGLKLFSKCPLLHKEQIIDRVSEQSSQDYFTFGSLVDAYLTEGPSEVDKKFMRVKRRISLEDISKIDVEIQTLESEIEAQKEKALAGGKRAQSMIEKRQNDIADLRSEKANFIANQHRIQVTESIYDNALIVAATISANPTFRRLVWNAFTSQQIFINEEKKFKARLDHVSFSPSVQPIYNRWRSGLISQEEMKTEIAKLPEADRWGRIFDIKTCADFKLKTFTPNIWDGQLVWYQDIVEHVTGIRCECFIIAGDKSKKKRAQDFKFEQNVLDARRVDILAHLERYEACKKSGVWPSAKELDGKDQQCWTCSMCSDRPFSVNEPFLVTTPQEYSEAEEEAVLEGVI